MLWGLFGWKIALIYVGTGVTVAIISGLTIGKLHMEKYVQEYVYATKMGEVSVAESTFKERLQYAREYSASILKRIWPYVLVGISNLILLCTLLVQFLC